VRSVRIWGKREIEKHLRDFKRSGLSATAWNQVWRWIMRYNVAVCDAILPERSAFLRGFSSVPLNFGSIQSPHCLEESLI